MLSIKINIYSDSVSAILARCIRSVLSQAETRRSHRDLTPAHRFHRYATYGDFVRFLVRGTYDIGTGGIAREFGAIGFIGSRVGLSSAT